MSRFDCVCITATYKIWDWANIKSWEAERNFLLRTILSKKTTLKRLNWAQLLLCLNFISTTLRNASNVINRTHWLNVSASNVDACRKILCTIAIWFLKVITLSSFLERTTLSDLINTEINLCLRNVSRERSVKLCLIVSFFDEDANQLDD